MRIKQKMRIHQKVMTKNQEKQIRHTMKMNTLV